MGTEYPSGNGQCRRKTNPNEPVHPVPAHSKQTTKETETGNQPELNSTIIQKEQP
jgi:hypothetical protein